MSARPGATAANGYRLPPQPCGSEAAYQRHARAHEPRDAACRAAHNRYKAKLRRRAAARRMAPCVAARLALEATGLGLPGTYEEIYARALAEALAEADSLE